MPHDEKNLAEIEKLIAKEIPRLASPLAAPPAEDETEAAEAPGGRRERERDRDRKRDRSDRPERGPRAERAERSDRGERTERPERSERPERVERAERVAPVRAETRDEAPRGRRDRRGRDRDDVSVVGLGDHLPSFIALSFEERRAG